MPLYLVTVASRAAASPQTLYLLAGRELAPAAVSLVVDQLLRDQVVQQAHWQAVDPNHPLTDPLLPETDALVLEVAYRPGVTDSEGESVIEGARRLGVRGLEHARALRRYLLPPDTDPAQAAADLSIEVVHTTIAYHPGQPDSARTAWYAMLVADPAPAKPVVATVPLRAADDAELLEISRRGVLALDLAEMRAIQAYFAKQGRDPTDGELETIAQTWSEHCSHKTFKARVQYEQPPEELPANAALHPMLARLAAGKTEIDSLIRTFLMRATEQALAGRDDQWVLSAFVDNAGILAFAHDYEVSYKVETHNHPSALEPFGGANTGVGGVIRDVLGVSARPIANIDVLCFGMPDAPPPPPGVLHPRRIASGVVAGVRDYGNKLGIPTVGGAVLFDPGYTANPLVYCGTVGLAPRGMHPRNAQPGDIIVVLGGRTGRDGIHGATFSSIELTHTTASEVGSAVQIGDPITEKKMLDVLLQARDAQLYSAITDCGAGGLSSAVGEMGAELGAEVHLEHVPCKYAGLQPWEIWLSEAQERMVLAVPPDRLVALLTLCTAEEVEATPIGRFTNDGRLRVYYHDLAVVDLDMDFLHEGRPQRILSARWEPSPALTQSPQLAGVQPEAALLALLAHPSIASKERIIRTYDHEVGGGTVIKPLVGANLAGPSDAAVIKPVPGNPAGLALGFGICPRYGRHDPYWMALAAIDEALRNVVAVGGDPDRTAILDNFCWGDPKQPDRMAGLVRAAAACYDGAVAFGTPFISGKDSLNNEYRDADGKRVAIPPTLLISALSHVHDIGQCVTMDLKQPGDVIYLLGATRAEFAGSHLAAVGMIADAGALPRVDLAAARATFRSLHRAIRSGLVRACHDLSEGGLAVAAAEMAIAGDLGLQLNLDGVDLDPITLLFSETPSRFLIAVEPAQTAAFEAAMADLPLARLGVVTATPMLQVTLREQTLINLPVAQLREVWQHSLDVISVKDEEL
ncbi:phosphoribosylformylglycinamidine synthase subunit PurL [Chloroflexus sp.]|uniref:phosphoribosylformylglycinamidine synthase subunit PurL n=1 Tax=Chloroflexus sp. TaxID=1904827 RepID=UPI00298ED754|nr:phosphoribosylformylglycinamidine synthase subunit PurL [Chloroflexus sp.]MDW8403304.1 phosphoribosylformylglycinamidine synthase subunit PurL [Chloroflexus sp.]